MSQGILLFRTTKDSESSNTYSQTSSPSSTSSSKKPYKASHSVKKAKMNFMLIDTSASSSSNNSNASTGSSSDLRRKRRIPTYVTRATMRSLLGGISRSEDDDESTIYNYTIDPYDYDDTELINFAVEMFEHFDLPRIFRFSIESLQQFFQIVRDMYNPSNDFHNFKHAWGVMHLSFQILIRGGAKYLNTIDVFAVLLAAICHDVRHPGNNNAFELAVNSAISKVYGKPDEVCVLERYHTHLTLDLIKGRNRHDILTFLTEHERQQLTNKVQYIILGTDMGKHKLLVNDASELVEQFKASSRLSTPTNSGSSQEKNGNSNNNSVNSNPDEVVLSSSSQDSTNSNGSYTSTSPQKTSSKDNSNKHGNIASSSGSGKRQSNSNKSDQSEFRLKLTRLIVHCADIGAQTLSQTVAVQWAHRCYAEFNSQAHKEETLGIMTAAFLHDLKEDSKKFNDQYFFIQNIVQPIWDQLTQLFPELRFAFDQLVLNKECYKEMVTK